MRLKDILNPKPIVESSLKVGSMIFVHGFPMLKGLNSNQYYKVMNIDGDNISFQRVNKQGSVTNFSNGLIQHKLSSINAAIQDTERADINGVEIVSEATASDIVKDLDKVRNELIKKVDVLIAKKKKLYSNVDIESPMSADEKQLDKDIQSIFSQIQQIIQQKRKIKNESINELTYKEKQIKTGNPANVFYAFYKGKFDAVYWAMNPSSLYDMYWDEFKVRRPAGSQFKLNPEFIIVPKKEYDKYPNHYSKLKPYVDKFWDKLQNESINEKWSKEYKDSIDCNNPKGFSQKAHCAGKEKNESMIKLKDILNEGKYPVYHKSYTSAINTALEWAEKQGYEYDKEETAQTIGLGPKKPSAGKTNRFSISLTKGGKPQRKALHIQVYNMGTFKRNADGSQTRSLYGGSNEYELNTYIS
jgi:hypothetical protein